MLKGKKILLGVTAGIAAYKAAYLVRMLKKKGAEVKVVLTPSAKEFVTPLTLSTLSGNPVYSDFADNTTGEWNSHVELALWADAIIIAPATANTIAKMANGTCDNLLLAIYLSARSKVFFAPAMDLDMYRHPAVQSNINTLIEKGAVFIKPGTGELASGLTGEGRMAEPEEIVDAYENYLSENAVLKGKKVLITAGPTFEQIDPVRFIGNNSSGKMGIALAEQFAALGAKVVLVYGPGNEKTPDEVHTLRVVSAEEMYDAVNAHFNASDIVVYAAAVADFKPVQASNSKVKKSDALNLQLVKTKDIALEMSARKNEHQIIIGFALETDNEEQHAKEKLRQKKFDMIVLNSLNDEGAGFKSDTNKIKIFSTQNKYYQSELKTKKEIAKEIINFMLNL